MNKMVYIIEICGENDSEPVAVCQDKSVALSIQVKVQNIINESNDLYQDYTHHLEAMDNYSDEYIKLMNEFKNKVIEIVPNKRIRLIEFFYPYNLINTRINHIPYFD